MHATISYTCPNCGRTVRVPDNGLPMRCTCTSPQIAQANDDSARDGAEPYWVRVVRRMRKPGDHGVGDTVQRIAARIGGEQFKRWTARLGIPCGCTQRQEEWNARWPYH